MPQKHLPVRACGFESRSRHRDCARLPGLHRASGIVSPRPYPSDKAHAKCQWHEGNIIYVSSGYGKYGASPIRHWPSRPGECPDLWRIGGRHPALALRVAAGRPAIRPLAAGSAVPDATAAHWTNQRMHTCWASTLAMGTLPAAGGTYSRSHCSAPMTGRVSSQLHGARCLQSCPPRASSASSGQDALRLRARPSTGRACSRSTGPAGNTPGRSGSSNGNPRS
jgi:hypothetical protein